MSFRKEFEQLTVVILDWVVIIIKKTKPNFYPMLKDKKYLAIHSLENRIPQSRISIIFKEGKS